MIFEECPLSGAFVIRQERFADERGCFARTWCRDEFAAHGIDTVFLQASLSVTRRRGSLRGLHFQADPHGEAKLVRCARGSLFDVIVDIRPQSPTFRQWFAVELSAENGLMMYMPVGFAHGFQTLTDDVEADYRMSTPYVAHSGRGLRFDDPALGVTWPLPVTNIAERDRNWPLLEAGA